MGLQVIITGATGMVGEGVMHECLQHPAISKVLLLCRKDPHVQHPKLEWRIQENFHDLGTLRQKIEFYDACFFCLGVSSIGLNEKDYSKQTYDLTINVAKLLAEKNPDMTFCYVSGSGTDSSETGRSMWARVKGKTENDLIKLFPKAYMFRPGLMKPTPGLKNTLKSYKYIMWMYGGLKRLFPNFVCTLAEVGQAMINAALFGYNKKVLEVKDIKILAAKK